MKDSDDIDISENVDFTMLHNPLVEVKSYIDFVWSIEDSARTKVALNYINFIKKNKVSSYIKFVKRARMVVKAMFGECELREDLMRAINEYINRSGDHRQNDLFRLTLISEAYLNEYDFKGKLDSIQYDAFMLQVQIEYRNHYTKAN